LLAAFFGLVAAVKKYADLRSSCSGELIHSRGKIANLQSEIAALKASLVVAQNAQQTGRKTPVSPHWAAQPQCASDSQKVRNEQKRWNSFCSAMSFPFGGNAFQQSCLTVSAQSALTDLTNICATPHGSRVGRECMGPLGRLIGTWEGEFGKSYISVPKHALSDGVNNGQSNFTNWRGWSDIALESGLAQIPGKPTAHSHNIKQQTFKERIIFTPIYGSVRNRGYEEADHINPRCEGDQNLVGVRYSLRVKQTSRSDADGEKGGVLHEEVRLLCFRVYAYVRLFAVGFFVVIFSAEIDQYLFS
jgi:hypothetical protein